MAIIKDGYDDQTPESAKRKGERRWKNNDVAKRYKAERPTYKPPEPSVRVITPNDEDIETIAQQRATRIKTVSELRKMVHYLKEIVIGHRSTITLRGPELKGQKREMTLAAYRASLEKQKRKLLLEKLRRLEEAQQG